MKAKILELAMSNIPFLRENRRQSFIRFSEKTTFIVFRRKSERSKSEKQTNDLSGLEFL